MQIKIASIVKVNGRIITYANTLLTINIVPDKTNTLIQNIKGLKVGDSFMFDNISSSIDNETIQILLNNRYKENAKKIECKEDRMQWIYTTYSVQ